MEKFTKVIGEETYDFYTEIREGTDCLCVIMEKMKDGKVQTYPGNYQSSSPVGSYQTAEGIAEKLIKQMESSNAHTAWKNEIRKLTNLEKVAHPSFAYFRHKSYGVAMYFRSKYSPTGVENMGGFDTEEFYKLGLDKHGVAQRNDL